MTRIGDSAAGGSCLIHRFYDLIRIALGNGENTMRTPAGSRTASRLPATWIEPAGLIGTSLTRPIIVSAALKSRDLMQKLPWN